MSGLTGIPVRGDVAMTGEITLTGRVLAIGGLREKSMAALRSGIKTVIIPAANETDIEEFSPTVKNGIKFVPVKSIDEVFKNAFAEPPKPKKPEKEKPDGDGDKKPDNTAPAENEKTNDEVKTDEV